MTNNTLQEASDKEAGTLKKSTAREYTEAILIALLLALLIRTFIIQAFKIPSGSMENTLLIGDHILVSKFSYGTHIPNEIPFLDIKLFDDIVLFSEIPQRGDIIVFKFPKDERRDFKCLDYKGAIKDNASTSSPFKRTSNFTRLDVLKSINS